MAHTQLSLTRVGAEAGLIALHQWLKKTAGEARFRPGAAVNVVFISDTHDPGMSAADLEVLQPTVSELLDLVEEDETVASFRLHAIAPETECSESFTTQSYFQAAEATGGVTADICTATDYASIISEIAQTGALTQAPVFALGYAADTVHSVTLDGAPVRYTLEADGAAIRLMDSPSRRGMLRVRYE